MCIGEKSIGDHGGGGIGSHNIEEHTVGIDSSCVIQHDLIQCQLRRDIHNHMAQTEPL